ncbi:MAG: TetR/AcrR family transcriptional regulator [Acidimicrobiales bacterium]
MSDSRARVLDAAVRCVARFGVAKTTVEDVAREARLSRATLYRLFPGGRDDIVVTMVEREVAGFFGTLAGRLDGVDDPTERIVVAMTAAADQLVEHRALGFVLAHEPEVLLPHVLFTELDHVLASAGSFFAPYLSGLLEAEDARRVGEWMTRLVLSHVVCPPGAVDDSWPQARANSSRDAVASPFALHPEPLSEDRARWLVQMFIVPGIRALTAASTT